MAHWMDKSKWRKTAWAMLRSMTVWEPEGWVGVYTGTTLLSYGSKVRCVVELPPIDGCNAECIPAMFDPCAFWGHIERVTRRNFHTTNGLAVSSSGDRLQLTYSNGQPAAWFPTVQTTEDVDETTVNMMETLRTVQSLANNQIQVGNLIHRIRETGVKEFHCSGGALWTSWADGLTAWSVPVEWNFRVDGPLMCVAANDGMLGHVGDMLFSYVSNTAVWTTVDAGDGRPCPVGRVDFLTFDDGTPTVALPGAERVVYVDDSPLYVHRHGWGVAS